MAIHRLTYAVLAILIAWYAGPWLSAVLWFLPVQEVADALVPDDLFDRDSAFYVTCGAWALVIYAVLRVAGLTFLRTGIQRYETTPVVRGARGIAAESMLVAISAGAVIAVLLVSGLGK